MIRFAAPGFLLAGSLFALVPLALHMLVRTPPERRPLPTARFLTPDRRTRLRLRPPSDVALLMLRMLLALLAGAAFARPEWVPERTGSARVVALDAGAGMAGAWEEAVAAARERMQGGAGAGSPATTLIVFDTSATVLGGDVDYDSLLAAGPATHESSYLNALRGLRAAAAAVSADSVTAVLVSRPRWGAWSPAVPATRGVAWPGALDFVAVHGDVGVAGETGPAQDAASVPMTIRVVGATDRPPGLHVTAALAALGHRVSEDGGEPADSGVVLLTPEPASRAGGPARILFAAGNGPVPAELWERAGRETGAGGRILLSDDRGLVHVLDGWRRIAGRRAAGTTVVAVWGDGRPAAVADHGAGGCTAFLAAEPVSPLTLADPAFPHLVAALLAACAGPGGDRSAGPVDPAARDTAALDSGARRVLAGDDLPRTLALSAIAPPPGRALLRAVLALALLVAVAESLLARRRRDA